MLCSHGGCGGAALPQLIQTKLSQSPGQECWRRCSGPGPCTPPLLAPRVCSLARCGVVSGVCSSESSLLAGEAADPHLISHVFPAVGGIHPPSCGLCGAVSPPLKTRVKNGNFLPDGGSFVAFSSIPVHLNNTFLIWPIPTFRLPFRPLTAELQIPSAPCLETGFSFPPPN